MKNYSVKKALHRRPDLGEDIVFDRTDNIRQAFGDSVRSQHLKQIFRPPVDLMFRGDWDQVDGSHKNTKLIYLLICCCSFLLMVNSIIHRNERNFRREGPHFNKVKNYDPR